MSVRLTVDLEVGIRGTIVRGTSSNHNRGSRAVADEDRLHLLHEMVDCRVALGREKHAGCGVVLEPALHYIAHKISLAHAGWTLEKKQRHCGQDLAEGPLLGFIQFLESFLLLVERIMAVVNSRARVD